MFKRFLVFGMAAMLFLSDVPMTVYATNAVQDNSAAVVTEQTAVEDVIIEEIVTNAVVPLSEVAEEVVTEAPAVIREESEDELDVTFTLEKPESNLISAELVLEGYEDWSDYYNRETIYLLVSESESFENFDYMNTYQDDEYVSDGYKVTKTAFWLGKTETDYYVKAAWRDEEYEWHDVIEAQKVTTKKQLKVDAEIKAGDCGVSYFNVEYSFNDIHKRAFESYVRLQVSTKKDFSDYPYGNSMYNYEAAEDNMSGEGTARVTYRSPETTYYARLVIEGAEETVPVNDTVLTFTTQKDVEYEDSKIPDEALRNYIKTAVNLSLDSKLKKSYLERVTSLYISRSNVSNPAIKKLTGLELLPCLESFYANYHEVEDISVLAKVKNLRQAGFSYNKIKTIPDLSGLKNLTDLNLQYNFIPASAFTADVKLPAAVTDGDWLNYTAESQRTSEEAELVLADTYYQTKENVYPIQVELNNFYPISQYTLSIYEGEELLEEDLATTYSYSWNDACGWVIPEFATKEGTRELTFVVYENGEEAHRFTQKIRFVDEAAYNRGNYYQSADATSYYVNAYLYGVTDPVTDIWVIDSEGNAVARNNAPYGYVNNNSTDYRYEGIFNSNGITVENYYYVYGNVTYSKECVEGVYDLKFTTATGKEYIIEDAIEITKDAIFNSAYLGWEYERSGENDVLYVNVSGVNMPWDKITPTVYDAKGQAITKVVDYKLTDTESAVYKLEKLEGKSFDTIMELKVVPQKDVTILNNASQKISLETYPRIYYVEHIADRDQVRVLLENVREGVEYTWKLMANGYNVENVVATCVSTVKDGQAILEFKDADGKKYAFEGDKSYYYLSVAVNYEDTENTQTYNLNHDFNNYNYTGSSYNGYYYSESVNVSNPYLNNGDAIEAGYYGMLKHDLMEKDTKITAKLMEVNKGDTENEAEVKGTVSVEKKEFTNSNDNDTKYWSLKFKAKDMKLENGKAYAIMAYVGEKCIGQYTIYALDPKKPAYDYRSLNSYSQTDNTLVFLVRGYWPEKMDENKLSVKLTDAVGNVLFEGKPNDVRKCDDAENESIMYSCRYLDIELGKKLKDIQSYNVVYYEVLYDGEPIVYQYGSRGLSSFSLDFSADAWLQSERDDDKYKQYFYYGVYKNMKETTYTVKIYKPYDAEVLKEIAIPAGEWEYNFKDADLKGLTYNSALERYDIILVDANGEAVRWSEGYLMAKKPPIGDIDQSSWMYSGASYVFERGIMTGKGLTEDGYTKFDPLAKITRAELVQILYSAEGKPEIKYTDKFSDVAEGQWYTNAILWAAEEGIVSGYKNGKFGVSDPITREQLALMLRQYAKYSEYDITATSDINTFKDANKASSWSKEALGWAVANKVMSGAGDNLKPLDGATRAECAAMIRSFFVAFEN